MAQQSIASPIATKLIQPTTVLQPSATSAPPTATPLPSEALSKVAADHFRDKLIKASLADVNYSELARAFAGTPVPGHSASQPGDRVVSYATIDYDLGTQRDEGTAVRSATFDLARFAPKVFAISAVGTLELRAFTGFTDVYGNKNYAVAVNFTMSRATAERVNWFNVDRKNLGILLSGKDDSVYVHAALKRAWDEYVK